MCNPVCELLNQVSFFCIITIISHLICKAMQDTQGTVVFAAYGDIVEDYVRPQPRFLSTESDYLRYSGGKKRKLYLILIIDCLFLEAMIFIFPSMI